MTQQKKKKKKIKKKKDMGYKVFLRIVVPYEGFENKNNAGGPRVPG